MKEYLLEIKLPYQRPQNILVRQMANGIYRLALMDRFDRVEYLNGEFVGCALCLITKIILSPMVKLTDYVQAKVERKKLETVK